MLRRPLSPKNKQLLALCFCVLLSLPSATLGRKVAVSRVTKPTAHRGYANSDIAKLSYSPSHAAAPKPAAAAPAPVYSAPPGGSPQRAPGGQPPAYGWNVPGAGHGGVPAGHGGAAYPGAAVAGAAGTGLVAGNVYRSHGHNATGGGLAHSPPGAYPSYPAQPVQGFPGAPVQHPGGGFPAQGYQPQPQYVPQQQQGGFPHQPSYVPAGGQHYDQGGQQPGHYQGHPGQTVVHHYEQPAASGGSGLGTILGAGAAGLAAGVGGAALYDALKPKEAKEEPTSTAAATTTAAATIAGPTPVPAAASETPVPLAPLPENPNGDAPLAPIAPTEATPLATTPAPAEGDTTTTSTTAAASPAATSSSENPLGMAPLAPLPDSSPATPGDATGADVEARHSSLNVQPDLSASMAEPASGSSAGTVHITSAISLFALLPVIVKYLRC